MGQDYDGYRGLPISSARLCELEAEVCACGSGVDINVVQFAALMGRKWCRGDLHTDGCQREARDHNAKADAI